MHFTYYLIITKVFLHDIRKSFLYRNLFYLVPVQFYKVRLICNASSNENKTRPGPDRIQSIRLLVDPVPGINLESDPKQFAFTRDRIQVGSTDYALAFLKLACVMLFSTIDFKKQIAEYGGGAVTHNTPF